MATLADELLNDFEDSGSERGDDPDGGLDDNSTPPTTNGTLNDGMVLDGDEEGDDDNAMEDVAVGDTDDQEDAKAKVEKMQLGGVSDVRNVAGLMKTLEPVLEVSSSNICPSVTQTAFTSLCKNSPDNISSPPENCILPEPATRKTDHHHRIP